MLRTTLQSIFVLLILRHVSAFFGDILQATGVKNVLDIKNPITNGLLYGQDEENGDVEAMLDSELLSQIELSAAENLYFLYTRKNVILPQSLYFNNITSILSSNFNPNLDVIVISHGWTGNLNTNLNPILRDAYLNVKDVNLIVIDWSRLSYSNYITSTAGVPIVGQGLGKFLEFLRKTTGVSYEQMHLIGYSLGAHVMGSAGRLLRGKVGKITALDPAGPLWFTNPQCISKSDALYVEAIHTNAGFATLGINKDVGHADFYPNGGSNQPGCTNPLCSHDRSWEMLAATILHEHLIGAECTSPFLLTLNLCKGKKHRMGSIDLKMTGYVYNATFGTKFECVKSQQTKKFNNQWNDLGSGTCSIVSRSEPTTGVYRFNTDSLYPYKVLDL